MKLYVVKKPTNRDWLKKEDLIQGIKHNCFDPEGYVLCYYDECGRVHKDNYKIEDGLIFIPECLQTSKRLIKELFSISY
jgi:hypothetical protein